MNERLRQALPALVGLILFLVALVVLRAELQAVRWPEITRDILGTPPSRLVLAVLLTALNYLVLTGYDLIAFRYIGKALPRGRIVVAAFLAYAVANNVGVAMLSGASVRYRFYSRWGVTAEQLSRIVFSYSVTFWLGLFALGGIAFVVSPLAGDPALPGRGALVVAGCLLMVTVVGYLAATAVRTEPLRVRRFVLPLPGPGIAVQQLLVSSADWALAGAVLYVLLPPGHLSFFAFLGAFLIAILLGMVSHVPGGVGVFEGLMVLLLRNSISSGELLPALVVFRVVYYLLPFAVALLGLVGDEIYQRRAHVARAGRWFGRITEWVTPKLLAAFTFLSGLVLLASGATPAAPGRLDLLNRLLPLGVVEASHFVGSVAGAGLLVLSQGLARRLDAAYYLSSILIVVGMTASLLKGFDYEEALLLLLVLAILRQSRGAFDRRAAFLETRFSVEWIAALVGGIGASVWLGFFAYAHVDYAHQLWWQFELHGEASRFLRASVGASIVVLLTATAWMMRAAPHEIDPPTTEDLADAERVIAAQPATTPVLVYLRDKAVLFDESRTAFVMYGVQGRTWLALGDPVGPIDRTSAMIRAFLERCDDFNGTPAFYEVGTKYLHRYADFGLTFVKLGEEARVDLRAFTMHGGSSAKYRQVTRRLEKAGGSFRLVEAADVASIMPQLRRVSDDWLSARAAAEKGFSLGFFDEPYLQRFPVAVIEKDGRIVAFANLWPGAGGVELSLDLMRYHREAPRDVMEALLIHAILWGKEHGYQWFALGMAPLSGFEASPLAPFWQRLGGFVYKHGERVYSFQGLRGYKEKFNPVWEPRYLAYPGGLSLPRILADASALIAGGYRRIFLG
jgi:phosphatidylglycerol lysyltransferase